MDILVQVTNQKIRIATNMKCIVSGSQSFIKFVFDLTPEWEAISPYAQFIQDGNVYNVSIDNSDHSCYLPTEIHEGVCTIGIYGTDGDSIGTSNAIALRVIKSGYVADSSEE